MISDEQEAVRVLAGLTNHFMQIVLNMQQEQLRQTETLIAITKGLNEILKIVVDKHDS